MHSNVPAKTIAIKVNLFKNIEKFYFFPESKNPVVLGSDEKDSSFHIEITKEIVLIKSKVFIFHLLLKSSKIKVWPSQFYFERKGRSIPN